MILRLALHLEVDTKTKEARVIEQSGLRLCPGPCGGNVLRTPRYQHCSVACREAMKAKRQQELEEMKTQRRLLQ